MIYVDIFFVISFSFLSDNFFSRLFVVVFVAFLRHLHHFTVPVMHSNSTDQRIQTNFQMLLTIIFGSMYILIVIIIVSVEKKRQTCSLMCSTTLHSPNRLFPSMSSTFADATSRHSWLFTAVKIWPKRTENNICSKL